MVWMDGAHRQYYYWYLTAEGLEFLRQYLHIPTDGERAIVPATHKKAPPKGRPGLGGGKYYYHCP